MTEITKGLNVLVVLQLLSAAFVSLFGVVLVLLDFSLLDEGGILMQLYDGMFSAAIIISIMIAIVLRLPLESFSQIAIVVFLWSILGFFTAGQQMKLKRRARWLTLLYNLPLIFILALTIPLSYFVIIPILVVIALVVVRKEFV